MTTEVRSNQNHPQVIEDLNQEILRSKKVWAGKCFQTHTVGQLIMKRYRTELRELRDSLIENLEETE